MSSRQHFQNYITQNWTINHDHNHISYTWGCHLHMKFITQNWTINHDHNHIHISYVYFHMWISYVIYIWIYEIHISHQKCHRPDSNRFGAWFIVQFWVLVQFLFYIIYIWNFICIWYMMTYEIHMKFIWFIYEFCVYMIHMNFLCIWYMMTYHMNFICIWIMIYSPVLVLNSIEFGTALILDGRIEPL